eukprot:gnl/MRDRNA2_/MRDRNA2_89331_c0_seq1.p1 gnl/MRDRNA2_/MRDRNA2_89331_c0~~gnl/MRDRNA2_/MRDRNA2_89331_c0_seq1.p1  ORF type:complete len:291 (-),score=58.80 gnl/MRDRNA2_/MRDRNA2_89331_c0_seq1:208-1080(-)
MENVYGYAQKRTTPQQIEQQIQAALVKSIAHVHEMAQRDASDDEYDYNPAMDVATAADRIVRQDKSSRSMTSNFGCHGCLCVVEATRDVPVKVHVTVEHWHGWASPFTGPEKWEEIKLLCAGCAAPDLAKAVEARKRTLKCNKERADKQSKRLKVHAACNDTDDFMSKVHKLKVPQLSALCATNAVLKSGKKEQLIERLVGVWRFGSLQSCPSCKHSCFEMLYKGDDSMPSVITCKHMRGQGRPCGFSKKLTPDSMKEVLTTPLKDTAASDLASVGIMLNSSGGSSSNWQ